MRCDGEVVPFRRDKERILLAALLLNAGRVVSSASLMEALWGTELPPSAGASLQNHMTRLRRSAGQVVRARIGTQSGGYKITVEAGELDVMRAENLLRYARSAVKDGLWERAAEFSAAALSEWHGEPLADVTSELLMMQEVPRLSEMRLQLWEMRAEAALMLNGHAELIIDLRRQAVAHPLREHLHALLMLALYRCGHQAEAIASYQNIRRALIDELGMEPGPELAALHQRILAGDESLDAVPALPVAWQPRQPAVAGPAPPPVPRQLPSGVRLFSGRRQELATLTGLLDRLGGETSATMLISAIGGTAGVGKTALAVQWGHQVADRFPDGQLYVNLRGYDPGQPVPTRDALAGFLRALGVPGRDIPAEEEERAAMYRTLLAGKRVLVILDNAGSPEQVRSLLPGSPACVVVVTSRDSLAGLVARDGAARLDLDLLPARDAVGLLRALIGARVDADPEAAHAVADRCCRLPLALRVAAELAIARPAAPLAELADGLADQQRRLHLLEAGGDPRTAVRAVFSWSYCHLDADSARAFRLAGLDPGPDFDRYAVAALTETTPERAIGLLDQLAGAHLIQQTGPGRYAMHDLLRAYARELAAQDSEEDRRAALTRLFDYYLRAAATAMDTLYAAERHRRPRVRQVVSPIPPVTDPAVARTWLDAELACLIAVSGHAAEQGWPDHTTRLAATLFRHLEVTGHYPELVSMCTQALRAARRSGDRSAEAAALHDATVVDLVQGRYRQAADSLRQALRLYRELGDQMREARTLDHLGIASYLEGRYEEAARYHEQALALYLHSNDESGEARALNNLGLVELRQGNYERAAGRFREVLDRKVGDRPNEINSLANLGIIDLRQGRHRQATAHLEQALALSREADNPIGECYSLANLALVDLDLGRHQQARAQLERALSLSREQGDRSDEAQVLNSLGDVLLAAGQVGDARARHTAALGLASQIDDKYEKARAHNGLAGGHFLAGDLAPARHHWREALALYTGLGVPEADRVRAQISSAAGEGTAANGTRRCAC